MIFFCFCVNQCPLVSGKLGEDTGGGGGICIGSGAMHSLSASGKASLAVLPRSDSNCIGMTDVFACRHAVAHFHL